MDVSRGLIERLAEETLRFEFHSGDVTVMTPPHSTGWRTLPGLVTAHIVDATVAIDSPGRKRLTATSGQALYIPPHLHHRSDLVSKKPGISRWSLVTYRIFGAVNVFELLDTPPVFEGALAQEIGDINAELAARQRESQPSLAGRLSMRALSSRLAAILAGASIFKPHALEHMAAAGRLAPALSMIQANLAAPLKYSALARAVHLSPSRFHALFKSAMGKPPGAYVQSLRLRRAEELLVATTLTVDEIARTSGFNDPFHFSRLFKKHCGISPTLYRARAAAGFGRAE